MLTNFSARNERERESKNLRPVFQLALTFLVAISFAVFLPTFLFAASPAGLTVLDGLKLCLDTEEPSSLFADFSKTTPASSAVLVWVDGCSGYDAVASSTESASRPTYFVLADGKKSVKFQGAYGANRYRDYLEITGNPADLNFGDTASSTMFLVYSRLPNNGASGTDPEIYSTTWGPIIAKASSAFLDTSVFMIENNHISNSVHNSADTSLNSSPTGTNPNLYVRSVNYIETVNSTYRGTELTILNGYPMYSPYGASTGIGNSTNNFNTTANWRLGKGIDVGTFAARGFDGYLQAVYMYNRALSSSEIDTVSQYLVNKFNLGSSGANTYMQENMDAFIMYDGNSITRGNSGSDQYPRYLWNSQATSTNKNRFYNFGIGGQLTSEMISRGSTFTDAFKTNLPGFSKYFLVGWEGTNDSAVASTMYNNLVNYYTDRKNAGWDVVAMTILPSSNPSYLTLEEKRNYVNPLLRQNFQNYAEALVDIGNDPVIGQYGQEVPTTYYSDKLHPTNLGYSIVASHVKIALDALLNPLTAITNVATSTGTNSAIISWDSNVAASSIVDFGITSTYASSTSETEKTSANRSISHSKTISGLVPCSTYHYRAKSNQLNTDSDLVYLKNGTASTTDNTLTTNCTGEAAVLSSEDSTITTENGGSITLQEMELNIPAQYSDITSSALFSVKKLDSEAFLVTAGVPSGKIMIGTSVFNLTALIDETTELPTFSSPLTITMSYSPSDITNVSPSSLLIYHYDGSQWNALSDCSVDTILHKVNCSTNTFSDFSLFGTTLVPTDTTQASANIPKASTGGSNPVKQSSASAISSLLSQIEALNKQIALVSVSTPTSFSRNLSSGTSGQDVKSLQNLLISQGYLSSGYNTGYFGALTRSALAKYQKAKGIIPAVGYFGPKTRSYVSKQ